MLPAPISKLLQSRGRRNANIRGHLQLHAWREGEVPPHGPTNGRNFHARRFGRLAARVRDRSPDFVQRPPGLLQALHAQELFEVLVRVMVAATDAERLRDETFLHVVADGAPRDAAERRQVADW